MDMKFVEDIGEELPEGPLQTPTEPPPEPEPEPAPAAEPPQPVPPPARDEGQDRPRATRDAPQHPPEDAETRAQWTQQDILRAQAENVRAQSETVVLQSQAAREQAEHTLAIVASALETVALLRAAVSATPAPPKSGAEVVGASLNRVVDSVRELVQTALVVSGPQRQLAPRPAPPAAPSGKEARTGAEVEGAEAMDAGVAGAGAADPAGDFFGVNSHDLGVLFPDLPEELKSLPLAELRDVLLAYAAAKQKGGPR